MKIRTLIRLVAENQTDESLIATQEALRMIQRRSEQSESEAYMDAIMALPGERMGLLNVTFATNLPIESFGELAFPKVRLASIPVVEFQNIPSDFRTKCQIDIFTKHSVRAIACHKPTGLWVTDGISRSAFRCEQNCILMLCSIVKAVEDGITPIDMWDCRPPANVPLSHRCPCGHIVARPKTKPLIVPRMYGNVRRPSSPGNSKP